MKLQDSARQKAVRITNVSLFTFDSRLWVFGSQDPGVWPGSPLHRVSDQASPLDASGGPSSRGLILIHGLNHVVVEREWHRLRREERPEVWRPHQRGTHEGHGRPRDRHQYDQRGGFLSYYYFKWRQDSFSSSLIKSCCENMKNHLVRAWSNTFLSLSQSHFCLDHTSRDRLSLST